MIETLIFLVIAAGLWAALNKWVFKVTKTIILPPQRGGAATPEDASVDQPNEK
jgi:hypothetical protein